MNILIRDIEIIDYMNHNTIQHVYCFTRKNAERYVKKHEKEWEQEGWTWAIGGEPLYLGRVRD